MRPSPAMSGAVVAFLALVFAPPALGKTFEPNLRGDHAPGGCTQADCTLREAVLAANANGGSDKILLRAGKAYRLTRELGLDDPASGDLDVEGPLTMRSVGGGRSTIRVEGTDDRVLDVESPLRLRRLKLVGAPGTYSDSDSGGVILAAADLALKRVVVKNGNTAVTGGSGGGISILGPANLALDRSKVAGNRSGQLGGGIERGGSGAFTMVKSTVAGNVATTGNGQGGGVALGSSGLGRIFESTISGNLAHTDGGGIHVSEVFDLEIENSTFEGNDARGFGGGLFVAPESPTTMNAVTVARNRADSENDSTGQGGGMWAEGGEATLFVRNSLLARNRTTDGVYEQCDAPTPVDIESQGGNVLDTAASGCDFFGEPTDITGTQPGIRPLGFYGGPTKTVALGPSSGAIDEADGLQPPARDQRGVKRDDPDAGAYER